MGLIILLYYVRCKPTTDITILTTLVMEVKQEVMVLPLFLM